MIRKGVLCVLLAACLMTGCEQKVNYIEQGTLKLEEKQYGEAVSSFKQSLETEENPAEAYRGLGMAYYEQQDYQAAREAFQNVIDHGGEVTVVLYNLMGVCSMHLEDMNGALDAFQKGIALAGENGQGETASESAGTDQTADGQDLSEVVKEMKFNEIVCYEKLRDWQSAKEKAEAYTAEYPDDKDAGKEAQFLKTR